MEKLRETEFTVQRQAEIRERLTQSMLSRGVSQADLSRDTRMSSGHVNHLVHGRRPITPRVVLILAKAVGVSAHWLETGEGHPDDVDANKIPGVSMPHVEGALSPDQVIKLLAAAERERLAPDERKLLAKYQSLSPTQRARFWALVDAGAADPPEELPTMVNEVEAERGKGKG